MSDFRVGDAGPGGSSTLFNFNLVGKGITSGYHETSLTHETSLSTAINSYLDRYQLFIVTLYFPHNLALRQYLSTHLNHLDALTGGKILLVSFDYPIKDADELIEIRVQRLGNEHE